MRIQDRREVALFLDFDGTLVDIALTPEGIVVPDTMVSLIASLTERLDGALAIVTGRPIADIDRYLSPLSLVVAGVHGAEIRASDNGSVELMAPPIMPTVVEAVQRMAEGIPGILVEVKKTSISVHHRLAPDLGPAIADGLQKILDDSPDHLILCGGRKVFEIVPRHISKGAALETLLGLQPFRGRRPIMIGDDISDQSAFDAAIRLGGMGLKVAGEHFSRKIADFAGPADVHEWLDALSRSPTA